MRIGDDARADRAHQRCAVAAPAIIRMRAHGADLDEVIGLQALAGHRNENAVVANADKAAQRVGACTKRAGARERGEREHFGGVSVAQLFDRDVLSLLVIARATICTPSALIVTVTPGGGCGGAACSNEMSPSSGTNAPSDATACGELSMAAAKGLTSETKRLASAPPSPNLASREPSAFQIGLSRGCVRRSAIQSPYVVRAAGLEPAPPFGERILSPLRLPVSPRSRWAGHKGLWRLRARLGLQDHAPQHLTGAQIVDGAVGLVERAFVHGRGGDGALAHERDEFARFVEPADIRADDREWLQRQ